MPGLLSCSKMLVTSIKMSLLFYIRASCIISDIRSRGNCPQRKPFTHGLNLFGWHPPGSILVNEIWECDDSVLVQKNHHLEMLRPSAIVFFINGTRDVTMWCQVGEAFKVKLPHVFKYVLLLFLGPSQLQIMKIRALNTAPHRSASRSWGSSGGTDGKSSRRSAH